MFIITVLIHWKTNKHCILSLVSNTYCGLAEEDEFVKRSVPLIMYKVTNKKTEVFICYFITVFIITLYKLKIIY